MTPNWSEEIERDILALFIQDPSFAACVVDDLQPAHMSPSNAVMYGAVRDHYRKYGEIPTDSALFDTLRVVLGPKDAQYLRPAIVQVYREVKDANYVRNRVLEFINIRNLESSLSRASEHLISGSYEEAKGSVLAFREVGPRKVIDYFDDSVVIEEVEAIPTGILELDSYLLGGGLQRKREGIVVGGTGIGKSVLMLNFGAHAVKMGYRVLHIPLEDSREAVKRRYDCRFAGRHIKYGTKPTDEDRRMISAAKINGGSLQIREMISGKCTPSAIRMAVQAEKELPDLVIVDYLDVMRPDMRREDKRFEHEDIAIDLRGLAQEFECAVWVAKQADRAARNADKVGAENSSESYGPMRIADIVIGMARPPEQKRQGRSVLWLDKQRDGIDGKAVQCLDDRSRMLIRGMLTSDELDHPVREPVTAMDLIRNPRKEVL
jgi:replicative DNA helicase